jgi:hypothetical protein
VLDDRGEGFEDFKEIERIGNWVGKFLTGTRLPVLEAPDNLSETEPAMRPFEALSHRGQVSRLRRLVAEALAAYDVRPVRMAPLRRGDNVAFRLDTTEGQRYVLRIHRVGGNP